MVASYSLSMNHQIDPIITASRTATTYTLDMLRVPLSRAVVCHYVNPTDPAATVRESTVRRLGVINVLTEVF